MRSTIIVLLCLFCIKSWAQKNYKDSTSAYTFQLSVDSIMHLDSSGYSYYVSRIDIFQKEIFQQVIVIDSASAAYFPGYLEDRIIFVVEDVNFDGYNDIRLLSWLSTRFDVEYRYWFYNMAKGDFAEDSTLNEVMNPRFNHHQKLVCENYRSGADIFGFRKYRWSYGEILIIEELSHEVYPNKNGYTELLSHYTFENGKATDKTRRFKKNDWHKFPCLCE